MSLRRKTVHLGLISGISVSGGLVYHVLLGRQFGLSWQLDSLFVVLTLFAWLGLITTFSTSLFIPVFNEIKKEGLREGIIFADVLLKWLILISLLIIFLVAVFDDFIIGIIAPGFTEKGVTLCLELTGIIIFALTFYGISHLVILTLNALHLYSVPALTDLFEPVFNIAAVFVLVPVIGAKGIAVGCLLSNICKAAALLVYFHVKTGWRPTLVFYHPRLPELVKSSSRMTFSMFIWSLKDIIIKNAASRLGEGSVAMFSYADKIINTIILMVINPLARVFYSRVSEWISLSRWDEIKSLFVRVVRTNVFLSFIVSAGVILFMPSLLELVFHNSNFTAEDIRDLSFMADIMLVYLIIYSFEVYLARVVTAAKMAGTVAVNAFIGISVLYMCSTGLADMYGVYGLPAAVAITETVICFLYYFSVRKQLELQFVPLMTRFVNAFLVTGTFILFGAVLKNYVTSVQTLFFIVLPVWIVMYYMASRIFLKEELHILFSH